MGATLIAGLFLAHLGFSSDWRTEGRAVVGGLCTAVGLVLCIIGAVGEIKWLLAEVPS